MTSHQMCGRTIKSTGFLCSAPAIMSDGCCGRHSKHRTKKSNKMDFNYTSVIQNTYIQNNIYNFHTPSPQSTYQNNIYNFHIPLPPRQSIKSTQNTYQTHVYNYHVKCKSQRWSLFYIKRNS